LDLITAEVERDGGEAALSLNNFAGLSRIGARNGVRQLVALGFVKLKLGRRRVGVFRLATGWRAIDSVDAARKLIKAAKSPRAAISTAVPPKPVKVSKPVEKLATVEPRTRQRTVPSLPKLSCLQGDP
jgi:hypothetical protein